MNNSLQDAPESKRLRTPRAGCEANEFAERMEQYLARSVGQIDHALLRSAAEHLCLARTRHPGAKRVRPRLVWAFGHCLEQAPEEESLLKVAVAAELIHSASLLHDDVVDQGQTRRGRPTVNTRWGNGAAVLAGDMLLTQALSELSPEPPSLARTAVETVAAMTEAAMAEVEARGHLELTTAHWRSIAAGKTGALFAWCGSAVAQLGGDELASGHLARCGCGLGRAFQLADDLIDLVGWSSGKDGCADLKNREVSYPLLAAAEIPALREAIEGLWAAGSPADQLAVVGQQIAASSVTARAIRECEGELDQALDALGPYRSSAGGQQILQWSELLRKRIPRPPSSDSLGDRVTAGEGGREGVRGEVGP